MEVLQAIGWLLSESWKFFSEIKVPGFGFSIGNLFVGVFVASLGLRFLGMVVGVTPGSDDVKGAFAKRDDKGHFMRKGE